MAKDRYDRGEMCMDELKMGIIILNYNTYKETISCINSIKKYTKWSYKIYLVDNASPDCSGKALEKYYYGDQKIQVILRTANQGYSAGNNEGIRQALLEGCEYIFIVNSDVELLNNAFELMIETLNKNLTYMMVGPSIKDNNNCESQLPREKLTLKKFVFERHPFCDIPILKKLGFRKYENYENMKDGVFAFNGSVSGCCFGMRASDFKMVGLFDENVFLYSEEDILAYKMGKMGKRAVVNTKAKIWHKENVSTKREGNAFVQFHRWSSVLYMLKFYARINKCQQISIALWNTLTWIVLSIWSFDHRRRLKDFWIRNWNIVRKKEI